MTRNALGFMSHFIACNGWETTHNGHAKIGKPGVQYQLQPLFMRLSNLFPNEVQSLLIYSGDPLLLIS